MGNEEIKLRTGKSSPSRIGVVICECGGEISQNLGTDKLKYAVKRITGVTWSGSAPYPCSKSGRAWIKKAIEENNLEKVLVAGCSPRLVEKHFRALASPTGINPEDIDVTNIREPCAKALGSNSNAAYEAAIDRVHAGVMRLAEARPIKRRIYPVLQSAVVVGNGMEAIAAVHEIARAGYEVTFINEAPLQDRLEALLPESALREKKDKFHELCNDPMARILENVKIISIDGRPGDYEIHLQHHSSTSTIKAGVILLATDPAPRELMESHWIDRQRIRTQAEFALELNQYIQSNILPPWQDLVIELCNGSLPCSRICCLAALHQAILAKSLNPEMSTSILFSELFLGNEGEQDFLRARSQGIQFYRYAREQLPERGDKTIIVKDLLSSEIVQIPYDHLVLSEPMESNPESSRLAAILHIPIDSYGYLLEPRIRLRPGRHIDDGIFVLGGAHHPTYDQEGLFQAYLAASRAIRFLKEKEILIQEATAEVDQRLCTGCATCVPACPVTAIQMVQREELLSVSQVEPTRCIGCGSCLVACPVKAITLPGWEDETILAQIDAGLGITPHPESKTTRMDVSQKVLVLGCEWSGYATSDLAGARGLPLPEEARIIRMNCSARFDPFHVLWALLNGAKGVLLVACPPGECHYGTGNQYAKERFKTMIEQLTARGINPNKVRLVYISGDDAVGFSRELANFTNSLQDHISIPAISRSITV